MKNIVIFGLVTGFCLLCINNAWSFNIPSYISDPQDVNGNVCIIIDENAPSNINTHIAEEEELKHRETINEYATRLYSEALAIRVEMLRKENKKKTSSSTKEAIMQDQLKKQFADIAVNVKRIVELEAAISNLQGAEQLFSLGSMSCKDKSGE